MKRSLITMMLLSLLLLGLLFANNQLAATQSRTKDEPLARKAIKYPTMLDLTFPEFEAAAKRTDIVLLPVGSIEEHSSHLPLGTDAMNATAQLAHVQRYLRDAGYETILGPPLNIGLTNEAHDWSRDGTYIYPGSLTISQETFVTLYVEVLRSLYDNGMRRAFLYSGHFGKRHMESVAQIIEAASKKIPGMAVYAAIQSERLATMKYTPNPGILPIEKARNFEMMAKLLGVGSETPQTMHADGVETSMTLFFHPDAVRSGYQKIPESPSSRFLEAGRTGDRTKNPSGIGGFPLTKASASVGKQIIEYRTARIAETILQALKNPPTTRAAQTVDSSSFVGVWKLVSVTATNTDGTRNDAPWGINPKATIVYTREGWMTAVINYGGRKPMSVADRFRATTEEKAAAYETSFSYAGRYEVKDNQMIHHVEIASVENWVNTDLIRNFRLQGNRLVLVTPPLPQQQGKAANVELTWEHVK